MKSVRWPWQLLLCLAVAGLALAAYRWTSPPGRVHVDVSNIPAGTEFLCMVVEREGQVHVMNWYSTQAAGPLLLHPAGARQSNLDPSRPALRRDVCVAWEPGDRYGVVTRMARGDWAVTWFDASANVVQGRLPLLGGGEVRLDLALGRRNKLPALQAEELGLDPAWRVKSQAGDPVAPRLVK
jgi:hypothetical protein